MVCEILKAQGFLIYVPLQTLQLQTPFSKRTAINLSFSAQTKIDYILTRHVSLKHTENIKVICGEECAPQHRLLLGDFKLCTKLKSAKGHVPKTRIWKLKRPDVRLEYKQCVQETLTNFNGENVNDCWEQIKSCLLNVCDGTYGWMKGAPMRKETWWWGDTVNEAIKFKLKLWKEWKKGIKSKEEQLVAKIRAKTAVYFAQKSANDKKFGDLNSTEQRNLIFQMAHKMKDDNKDIIGEKYVKDQEGNMVFDDNSKAKAW